MTAGTKPTALRFLVFWQNMKSMICSLVVIAGLLFAFQGLSRAKQNASTDALIFERFDNHWFEGFFAPVSISQNGQWVLVGHGPANTQLYALSTGREDQTSLMGGLSKLDDAAFCGSGSPALARLGSRGTKDGWFLPGEALQPSTVAAAHSLVACSPDGSEIAYSDLQSPEHGIFVGKRDTYRNYSLAGTLTAATFSSDGELFYYLTFATNGESSLSSIRVRTGESQTVATHLDASWLGGGSIALSPDGKYAYLALASDGAPDNELRHKQNVDRWLKIYRMDLATGVRRLIVDSPGQDNTGPVIADGKLYWTRTVVHDSIVTLPLEGGSVKEVLAGGELPMWNTTGSKIGYYFGGTRLADIPLNLDDAVVNVDAEGNRTSEPAVIVSGYGEDFPPAWSPDGKWIAFHSHRSPTPVPTYTSAGSTDDIYLRRADDLRAPEIRLTDFGWETGPAYWSPDGHKLLFCSYKRGGASGINKLFVITVDTQKGAALKTEMLQLPKSIRSANWGAWSPDGKEIAIEDDRGAEKRILWIVSADGSHPEKLLDYEGTTYDGLDWTRDGKSIIYSGLAANHLQLFSIPRSGGAPRQLTADSGNLMHPRVSPDGRRIACTRIVQSKQIWRRPIS
jgi:Tol biopolymer transport system component